MVGTLLSEWSFKAPELPIDSWWFLGIVLVVLVVAIWLIARLTSSVTDDIDPAEIDRQMLTAVRDLHSQGELSPDEYRSIKGRLVERMSDQLPPAGSDDSSQKTQGSEQTEGQTLNTTEEPPGASTTENKSSDSSDGGADSSTNLLDEIDS